MSQPFAKPYERLCSLCGKVFRTDEPGTRWRSARGQVRYIHPGCSKPHKTWRQEAA